MNAGNSNGTRKIMRLSFTLLRCRNNASMEESIMYRVDLIEFREALSQIDAPFRYIMLDKEHLYITDICYILCGHYCWRPLQVSPAPGRGHKKAEGHAWAQRARRAPLQDE